MDVEFEKTLVKRKITPSLRKLIEDATDKNDLVSVIVATQTLLGDKPLNWMRQMGLRSLDRTGSFAAEDISLEVVRKLSRRPYVLSIIKVD